MRTERNARRNRWFGWWYLSIGAGFVLLGVSRLIQGDRFVFVLLRWLIAAGFFALGCFELRARRKP